MPHAEATRDISYASSAQSRPGRALIRALENLTGRRSLIARATAQGDSPLLLAGTLSMVLAVVVINRACWRRLYRLAEDRFRME